MIRATGISILVQGRASISTHLLHAAVCITNTYFVRTVRNNPGVPVAYGNITEIFDRSTE